MYGMELRELMAWREKAAIRSGNHEQEDDDDGSKYSRCVQCH
ncbi:GpE family phage tail protein [Escherichia coli]